MSELSSHNKGLAPAVNKWPAPGLFIVGPVLKWAVRSGPERHATILPLAARAAYPRVDPFDIASMPSPILLSAPALTAPAP